MPSDFAIAVPVSSCLDGLAASFNASGVVWNCEEEVVEHSHKDGTAALLLDTNLTEDIDFYLDVDSATTGGASAVLQRREDERELQRRAAVEIQSWWLAHRMHRQMVWVFVYREGSARRVGSSIQLPDDVEMQMFNYYHADLDDVFTYFISRLELGRPETHYLRTSVGRTLCDSYPSLLEANKRRDIASTQLAGSRGRRAG